jgi:pyrrolysine biosynthesis protein PylC
MLIAIIGGKLQGVEAVYLAQKAGWKTLVIDKNPDAPATGFCDHFLKHEFSAEHPVPPHCPPVEFILPAIEDMAVLTAVTQWAEAKNIPLAFDLEAYALSCSKIKSNALFRQMNLPAPKAWPYCDFPVVVKPSQASGSQGVEIFQDSTALFARFPFLENRLSPKDPNAFQNDLTQKDLITEEYMEGPSYSIEVLGSPGKYRALQVTDLAMDSRYDCKQITAPTRLSPLQIKAFEELALSIARKIQLKGIMDVEVILTENKLKLLEIDARLPSQTPMTVYQSSGINMVEMLGNLFLDNDRAPDEPERSAGSESGPAWARCALVEHLQVSGSDLQVWGEHIMGREGPLKHYQPFLGADEAITSFSPGKDQWVATLIFSGDSLENVRTKRKNCHEQIRKQANLTGIPDSKLGEEATH